MNSETKNIKKIIVKQSLELDCGKIIKNFPLAYETYGALNKKQKVMQYLLFTLYLEINLFTDINPITKREGWWTNSSGTGKGN